ncbi:PAS domain S-box protein [Bradyrhizobium roseum]|uniref:PAS domain S-box protein n=1 Tax=Bradyrhizobium roseum TaxID=3056648 RepID=UPI0026384037|nr:PAS domain S-box protein [Bradyrhizobium roseus]WKA31528.1 PAS domain S-box protein [Bradyrhizobium roseus]
MSQGTEAIWTGDGLFAALVQHSFDAIISKDLHGTVRTWNPAAERIFGWSTDEIIGKPIRLIIPEDRQGEEDRILERIKAGELVPKFETIRQHRSGKPVHVAITIAPLRDRTSNIVGASKIAHDCSEAFEARIRLEESEQQFRTLANSIPQLAWIADSDGYIFWYNERWYDYTGSNFDEMQGWGWTRVHHPDHVQRVRERIQQSWDSGQEWEDVFPLRRHDGDYRWFLSRAKPIFGRDGKVWRWFGTNTDITAQMQNEEQIRLLMGELSHRAKNMITVVQALVSRTVDRKYSESLANRLQALARNQDILTKRNWKGTPIGELIISQLAAVSDLLWKRIDVKGDLDFFVVPSAAETIGLAIHELTTNATKYGALSGSTGGITIRVSVDVSRKELAIEWREFGGPPVVKPSNVGFGTVMIDRNPRFAIGAEVEIEYLAPGLVWRLTAPLDRVAIPEA